jgi:hypothetical protein
MARLRYNGLAGTLGASLSDSATSVTFAAKLTHAGGDVPTITGSDYIPLALLDSDGLCVEIAHVTAYTAEATSGTIARGKESTTAVAHDNGATFVNAATVLDIAPRALAMKGSGGGAYSTTSTSVVDVDATNMAGNVPAEVGDRLLISTDCECLSNNAAGQVIIAVDINGTAAYARQTPVGINSIPAQLTFQRTHTVVAGDLSSGSVPIKLRFRSNNASYTASIANSSTVNAPHMTVVNLGQ